MPPRSLRLPLAITLGSFCLLVAWDALGWDMVLASWAGTSTGFPLRDNWLLSSVLHEGARRAAWIPAIWLVAGVWWPTGSQKLLAKGGRLRWAASTLLALAAVSLLKQMSHTSCPWDLVEFGGHAHRVSHWALQVSDAGPGRCFPAGHASTGFAFIAGWFALRAVAPRRALWWLAASLAAGLVFGIAQQLRGAHFMSHTLWTAWVCWIVAFACHAAFASRTQPVALPA
jgi:membrane-associated PAP2 superfamily phosphatase